MFRLVVLPCLMKSKISYNVHYLHSPIVSNIMLYCLAFIRSDSSHHTQLVDGWSWASLVV